MRENDLLTRLGDYNRKCSLSSKEEGGRGIESILCEVGWCWNRDLSAHGTPTWRLSWDVLPRGWDPQHHTQKDNVKVTHGQTSSGTRLSARSSTSRPYQGLCVTLCATRCKGPANLTRHVHCCHPSHQERPQALTLSSGAQQTWDHHPTAGNGSRNTLSDRPQHSFVTQSLCWMLPTSLSHLHHKPRKNGQHSPR